MRKKAFTLSEVLIALTVIGVVAAIVAPSLSNLIPNKDKVTFLKIYDSISTAASDIIENPAYYYGYSKNYYKCMGFACDSEIKDKSMISYDTSYEGIGKHQCLIADILNNKNSSSSFSCEPAKSENTFSPISGITVIMKTEDINKGNYYTNITINLGKDNKGVDKIYHLYMDNWGRINCGSFTKSSNGIKVTPDTMAQTFVDNRLKLNNKKEDSEASKNMSTTPYTVDVVDYGAVKIN
ncbi:MAG: type II secretion system GspH family protein [bacterium]|nr:type II secretion system GspH family protein [bacterium]